MSTSILQYICVFVFVFSLKCILKSDFFCWKQKQTCKRSMQLKNKVSACLKRSNDNKKAIKYKRSTNVQCWRRRLPEVLNSLMRWWRWWRWWCRRWPEESSEDSPPSEGAEVAASGAVAIAVPGTNDANGDPTIGTGGEMGEFMGTPP